jgi:hypothetical protein
MLRKTILTLALPLSLSLPAWGADEASVTSMLYEGTAAATATKPNEAGRDLTESLVQDRIADTGDAENVDCFYQEHANHPSCVKTPQARVADGAPGRY